MYFNDSTTSDRRLPAPDLAVMPLDVPIALKPGGATSRAQECVRFGGVRAARDLMDHLEASQVERRNVLFRAAYVLNPVAELPDGAVVTRDRLDMVSATIALVMHSKLGPVLTGSESPVILSLAADIVQSVPVYSLNVVRDLERIDEAARVVTGWHSGDEPEREGISAMEKGQALP